MSKRAAVRVEERQNKENGNHETESSSKSNANREHFPESDGSNSKSEYFASISSTAITSQPYPQTNFSKNAKISNAISGQTGNRNGTDEEQNNYLPIIEHKTLLKLEPLKQFYIRQNSNVMDTFLGFLRRNRYVVQDIDGKLIYHVFETSDNTCQCDCRTPRYSQLHFTTSTGQEEMRMEKMITCPSFFTRCGTYPVCCTFSTNNSHQIMIESPPGLIIGAVIQQISFIRPYYQVEDAEGNLKYFIVGSTHNFGCFACCCCNIQYEVISASKNILIGIIIKKWAETNDKTTAIDNFNISFPRNIAARDKMLLLGALFLIANFKCKFLTFQFNQNNLELLCIN